jgi:lysozyme
MTIKQQIHNWIYGENDRESNKHRLMLQHSIDMRIGIELAGLVMPAPGRVWGIDISHWNRPPVDLQRMKEMYGLKFVIIKGCDGSIRSRYFADHVAAAKAAGLPWGFYDWLYPNNRVSIDAQVNAWVSQALEFNPPMGIQIDAEWTRYAGQPANPSAVDLRSAHDRVRIKYKRATTYTAKGYADQYLRGFDFSREDFWVASYGGSRPLMPIGADDWLFWQFTATLDGHALDPDGNAELDGNYFFGTQAEFETRYGADTIPPPETGGSMWYRATGNINIRQMGVTGAPAVTTGERYVLTNDIVEVEVVQGGFAKLLRLYRNNERQELATVAWCGMAYLRSTTYTPPNEPPPDPDPEPEPVPTLPDRLWIGATPETAAWYRKEA